MIHNKVHNTSYHLLLDRRGVPPSLVVVHLSRGPSLPATRTPPIVNCPKKKQKGTVQQRCSTEKDKREKVLQSPSPSKSISCTGNTVAKHVHESSKVESSCCLFRAKRRGVCGGKVISSTSERHPMSFFYCYPRRNDINFVSWRLLGNLRMFVSLHRRLHVARRSSRVPLSLPGRLLVAVGSELVFRIAHAAGAGARARNLSSHIEKHSTKLASIR